MAIDSSWRPTTNPRIPLGFSDGHSLTLPGTTTQHRLTGLTPEQNYSVCVTALGHFANTSAKEFTFSTLKTGDTQINRNARFLTILHFGHVISHARTKHNVIPSWHMWDPFYEHGLTSILLWIRNHMPSNAQSIGVTPSYPSVTAIWSGSHHLVCPSPNLARVLPAGGWVGAYQTITPLFSAAFDVAVDKL